MKSLILKKNESFKMISAQSLTVTLFLLLSCCFCEGLRLLIEQKYLRFECTCSKLRHSAQVLSFGTDAV